MDPVAPRYTYRESSNQIVLKGDSCGAVGGYRKICPEDLVSNLHKSITKNFNCEDKLCMKPSRFTEFRQLAEEILNEEYLRINIEISNPGSNGKGSVNLIMYADLPASGEFSEEFSCRFWQDSVKEEMNVTCARTRYSCRSSSHWSNSSAEETKYDFSAARVTDYLKVGAGLASTIFFTYNAYQETRKIFEESKKPELESKAPTELPAVSSEHNKSAPKASPWRALAYTAAAVGSGIFSAYAFQDL